MTGDERKRVLDLLSEGVVDDVTWRRGVGAIVVGLFEEVQASREELRALAGQTLTADEVARVREELRDGAFWREAARRAGVALRALLAAAGAVVAIWAAWEVFGKMVEHFRGPK